MGLLQVYKSNKVWDGKEFDAIPLPASKSYLDVKGKIVTAAHPTEGTWPLDRKWLACFCPACQAANAAARCSCSHSRSQ
jgi:hypothetical protein